MPDVSPLLDDDGCAKGRTGGSGIPRCTVTKARGRLEVMVRLEAFSGHCHWPLVPQDVNLS